MPCASFSMLDGPSAKTQVSSTSFLQSEVKIIHIIVQKIHIIVQDQDGQNNNNIK